MSHFTEEQKEALLHTEYAIRHAIIELSSIINPDEIKSLGAIGMTLHIGMNQAKNSLENSSQLVELLLSKVEGK